MSQTENTLTNWCVDPLCASECFWKKYDVYLIQSKEYPVSLDLRLYKRDGEPERSPKVKSKCFNHTHPGGLQYGSYTPLQLFQIGP